MAKKAIRPIRIEGNVAYVPLTKGCEALIDAQDVPLVDGWNWWAVRHHNKMYAYRSARKDNGKWTSIKMHRAIVDASDNRAVDHVNGDSLDNRRSNLRLATHQQNLCNRGAQANNTSGFKGVSWHKSRGRWRADIAAHGKSKFLGHFGTAPEASAAYLAASQRLHGVFAKTA